MAMHIEDVIKDIIKKRKEELKKKESSSEKEAEISDIDEEGK